MLHIFRQVLFGAGNQGNHQNDLSLLSYKCWLIFIGMKQKNQNGQFKKTEIFNSPNSQYFFTKISGIGPWVSRINWREGHQCGSTYIVIRLSDVSSKMTKNALFCVFSPFLSLCLTAWWPYSLSHIDALRINLSYLPKVIYNFFFKKKICFIPMKIARIFWNFDDYPGFQPKTTPA